MAGQYCPAIFIKRDVSRFNREDKNPGIAAGVLFYALPGVRIAIRSVRIRQVLSAVVLGPPVIVILLLHAGLSLIRLTIGLPATGTIVIGPAAIRGAACIGVHSAMRARCGEARACEREQNRDTGSQFGKRLHDFLFQWLRQRVTSTSSDSSQRVSDSKFFVAADIRRHRPPMAVRKDRSTHVDETASWDQTHKRLN